MHDDNIILGCSECGMSFFLEALTEDRYGDIPNPLYCPFCSAQNLEEGFSACIEEQFPEERTDPTKGRPSLRLLIGGRKTRR